MAQTPSGIMSLPLAHLQTLIAASATFQSWVGAADAAAAKNSIHLINVPDTVLTRPFALIGFGEKWKAQKTAEFFHDKRGELFLVFEADVAEIDQASEADAVFAFMNQVGAVISHMLSMAGNNGYLNVIEAEMLAPPVRITSEDNEFEDYYTVEFTVVWGGL